MAQQHEFEFRFGSDVTDLLVLRYQIHLLEKVILVFGFIHHRDGILLILDNFVNFSVTGLYFALHQLLIEFLVKHKISKADDSPPKDLLCFLVQLDCEFVCNSRGTL